MKRPTLNRVVEFLLCLLFLQFGLSNCTEEDGLEQLPNGQFCVFTCSDWVFPDRIAEFAPSAELVGPAQLKENLIGLACLGDDNTRDVERFGNQLCYTGIWGVVFIIDQNDYTAVMQEAESSHERSFISFEEVMLTNPEKYMKCMTADLGALPGKYPLGRQSWDNIPNPEQDNAYYNQLENLGVPSDYINGLKALSQPDMCNIPSGDIIPVLDRTVGQSTVPEIKQQPPQTSSTNGKVPPMVLQSPTSSNNIASQPSALQTKIEDSETVTTRHVEGESSKVINDLNVEDKYHTSHQPVVVVTPIGPASKFGISDKPSTELEERHESSTLAKTVVNSSPASKTVSAPSGSSNLDNKVVPVKPKEIPSLSTHELTPKPTPTVIKPVESQRPKTHSQPFIVVTPISSLPSLKNLPSTTQTTKSPPSSKTITSPDSELTQLAPQQKTIPVTELSGTIPPKENVVLTESSTKEIESVQLQETVISESPTPMKVNEKPLDSSTPQTVVTTPPKGSSTPTHVSKQPLDSSKSPTVLINPTNSPSVVQNTNIPKPMFTLEGISSSSPICTDETQQPMFTLDNTSQPIFPKSSSIGSKPPLESETEDIPTVLISPPNSPPIIQNKYIPKPMFTLEGITSSSPVWKGETPKPVFTSNHIPSTVFPENSPEIQSKSPPLSETTTPELDSEGFEETPTVIINSPDSQQVPVVLHRQEPMFTLDGISSESSSFPTGDITKPMFTEDENSPASIPPKIAPNPNTLVPMFTVEGVSTQSSDLPNGEQTKPMFTLDENIQPDVITTKTLELDSKSVTVDIVELESAPKTSTSKIETVELESPPKTDTLKSPPTVNPPKIETVKLESPPKIETLKSLPTTTPPKIETVELESPPKTDTLKSPPTTTPPKIEIVELESPTKTDTLKSPPTTTLPKIETIQLESPPKIETLKSLPTTTPPKIETVELESPPKIGTLKSPPTTTPPKIETVELESLPKTDTLKSPPTTTLPKIETIELESPPKTTPKVETVELKSPPTTVPTKIEATKLESSKIETLESEVETVELDSKSQTIGQKPKLTVQENENFGSETVKITETETESETLKISESSSSKNDLLSEPRSVPTESSTISPPQEISNFIPNSAIPGFSVAFFHPEFSDILTSELMPSHQQAMYEPDEFIPGFVFGIGVQLFS